ncbi:HAD family hydrolase [Paroceanicella profunda]|uniref:phosphoglycolate phosphatase n=1 Tax=Paroceanicella profunda TaxID=2579971 RepID=A0A5B8FVK1_9RHOB|nr:HAD family hydrolase [Paroceanicella profunda]QDL90342.1 HAD family hydrolase [Paroceanicella profunda]
MHERIKGLLFDKDGTLFDFQSSWAPVFARVVAELAGDDAARAGALCAAGGFDAGRGRFTPASPVIAGTSADIAACLLPHLPGWDAERLEELLNRRATGVAMSPVTDLAAFTGRLRRAGLRTGVATNDGETAARSHLGAAAAGFDYIAGYDSGYGAKPGPGMVEGFLAVTGLAPREVAMVGDSLHDLVAARAAGTLAIAVLTGVAGAADLAPHADLVFDSIADLPAWLEIAP